MFDSRPLNCNIYRNCVDRITEIEESGYEFPNRLKGILTGIIQLTLYTKPNKRTVNNVTFKSISTLWLLLSATILITF